MKNKTICKNLFIIICLIICNSLVAQTYEKDYYDKKILYENAEILQLTDSQKRLIQSELNQSINNTDNFYNNTTISSQKKETDTKVEKYKQSFSSVVSQTYDNSISTNVKEITTRNYLIDF